MNPNFLIKILDVLSKQMVIDSMTTNTNALFGTSHSVLATLFYKHIMQISYGGTWHNHYMYIGIMDEISV